MDEAQRNEIRARRELLMTASPFDHGRWIQAQSILIMEDVPALLAEVDRLRAERDDWQLAAASWEAEAFRQGEDFDRLRAERCGATNPENATFVPCMLPPHDSRAPHWSTSGCAGGAVQWSAS